MRKDAIDGSALFLYRKADRERAVRPLFLSAPPSEANETVRRNEIGLGLLCGGSYI